MQTIPLTKEEVEAAIDRVSFVKLEQPDRNGVKINPVVVCVILMKNGYQIVGANASTVPPEEYSYDTAQDMSLKAAMDQVWDRETYALLSRNYVPDVLPQEQEQQKCLGNCGDCSCKS